MLPSFSETVASAVQDPEGTRPQGGPDDDFWRMQDTDSVKSVAAALRCRLTPVSREWGFDRGIPIDRVYIERFLHRHANHVKGHVLEIGDNAYTRQFGGAKVARSDVLNVADGVAGTTIVADLSCGDNLPSDTYDCIILTQTLQLIFDVRSAVNTIARILKHRGVLLATMPGISRISQREWPDSWYWGFTSASVRRLLEQAFAPEDVQVEAYGNVMSACAFLYGFAAEEFEPEHLNARDVDYEVLLAVKATKGEAPCSVPKT